MTPSELYQKFVRQLETEYSGIYSNSDRKDIQALLERRIRPEYTTLSFAMFAVKQWASKAKGLPDCATIRQAIDKYEDEYKSSLRPPLPDFKDFIPPIDIEEDRRTTSPEKNIYQKAEALGIDWHKEGWMIVFFDTIKGNKKAGGKIIRKMADLNEVRP